MMTAIGTVAGAAAILRDDAIARVEAAVAATDGASPADLAGNEDFWFEVQQAYDVDRSLLNLNNGGVAPSPRVVLEAMHRHTEFTNHLPSRHLWEVLDPQVEPVRKRLAKHFGCDAEEMAITRNASESLETCLLGVDLQRGDEVLTTSHDYPRMLQTLRQREKRDGVVLKTFPIPTPPKNLSDITRLFEQNLTSKTKMILCCHVINITGQILPVKEIVDLGRAHGIPVVVDGAHSFGHFPFKLVDLDCDYFGTSLHKWLSAPIGTGLLFVRKSKIAGLWPLMPPPDDRTENIRKFEEIGTHPTAPRLAIAEAMMFYEGIGPERKAARLRFLRNRWAKRLMVQKGVMLYTSLEPDQSCAIATVGIEGIKASDLSKHLFDKHRIVVTPIEHEHINGIRVTPNTYTTVAEVDRFSEVMERIVEKGIG
ncbi:MAG: aminotransferase class V-fold PLP-dependent enzyme [Planctomycetota bacterium]